jgi:hypothetical protein
LAGNKFEDVIDVDDKGAICIRGLGIEFLPLLKFVSVTLVGRRRAENFFIFSPDSAFNT